MIIVRNGLYKGVDRSDLIDAPADNGAKLSKQLLGLLLKLQSLACFYLKVIIGRLAYFQMISMPLISVLSTSLM